MGRARLGGDPCRVDPRVDLGLDRLPYNTNRSSAINKYIKSKYPYITIKKSISKN